VSTKSQSKSKKGKEEEKKKKSNKTKKFADDVIKPTKALSAYIFYSNEVLPIIKKEENVKH